MSVYYSCPARNPRKSDRLRHGAAIFGWVTAAEAKECDERHVEIMKLEKLASLRKPWGLLRVTTVIPVLLV